MTLERIGRILLVVGLVIVVLGLVFILLARLGVVRLPGDITIQGKGFTVYIPLGLCLLLSIIASIILGIFNRR